MPRPPLINAASAMSRRHWLTSAAAGTLGCGILGDSLTALSSPLPRRQLLILFLSGGPSQFETWDPKPGAKTGGPFRAIPTSIPGIKIGELLPHTAKILHRLTVVRSVASNIADHFQGHYALQSGRIAPGYPVLGSAVAKLLEKPDDILPGYISIRRNGPKAYTDVGDAGFLGAKYDGVRVYDNLPPENLIRPTGISPVTARSIDQIRRATDEQFRQRRDSRPIESYEATYQQAEALMGHAVVGTS